MNTFAVVKTYLSRYGQWSRFIAAFVVVAVLFSVIQLPSGQVQDVVEEQELAERTVQLISSQVYDGAPVYISSLAQVRSRQQLELRAEVSGTVIQVPVQRGQAVEAGQLLYEIDHSVADGQLQQAQGRLDSAFSTLQKLQSGDRPEQVQIFEQQLLAAREQLKELERGSRPEEVALTQIQIANARRVLNDAQRDLDLAGSSTDQDVEVLRESTLQRLNNVLVVKDRVLTQRLQDLIYPIRNPANQTCKLRFVTNDLGNIENECFQVLLASEALDISISGMSPMVSSPVLADQMDSMLRELNTIRVFLNNLLKVVDGALALNANGSNISDSQLTSFKNLVTTSQSELEQVIVQTASDQESLRSRVLGKTTQLNSFESAVQRAREQLSQLEQQLVIQQAGATLEQLEIQKSNIRQLEIQLDVAKKGARTEDIAIQQSQIQSARGDLSAAIAQRDKAFGKAVFASDLVYLNVSPGDYVQNGDLIAILANTDAFEVHLFVSRDDARYLYPGAEVSFGGLPVEGAVREVARALDPVTKQVQIVIDVLKGQDALLIGESVELTVLGRPPEGIQRVPLSSVRLTDQGADIFLVDEDNVIQKSQVEVLGTFGDTIEIQGLENDQLFVLDSAGLIEGETVLVQKP